MKSTSLSKNLVFGTRETHARRVTDSKTTWMANDFFPAPVEKFCGWNDMTMKTRVKHNPGRFLNKLNAPLRSADGTSGRNSKIYITYTRLLNEAKTFETFLFCLLLAAGVKVREDVEETMIT